MKRVLFFIGFFTFLLLLASCTTPDPDSVYDNPEPIVSNGNIAGPRIVVRIDSNNVTKTLYQSTHPGVLQNVVHFGGKFEEVEFGTSGKVSKIKFNPGAVNRSTLTMVYNAAGTLTNAVLEEFANNSVQRIWECGLSYNTDNKLSHIEKKLKNLGTNNFISYTRISLTYSGENIVHITSNSAPITGNVYTPLDPNNAVHYIFEGYGTGISPYTTLPKEYLTGVAIPEVLKFANLSQNSYLKVSRSNGSAGVPAVLSQYSGFNYDVQNYLISSSNGAMKVFYKPLQ